MQKFKEGKKGANIKCLSIKIHHPAAFPTVYVFTYPPYILCDIVEELRLRNKAVIDAGSSSCPDARRRETLLPGCMSLAETFFLMPLAGNAITLSLGARL